MEELQELKDSIDKLYNSPHLKNQLIAISQVHLIGMSKADFIWNHIKSNWSKSNIINNWGLAYADGTELRDQGEIEVFKMDFLGGELRIIDLSHSVFLDVTHVKGILKLVEWKGSEVHQMYNKTFKSLKSLIFTNTHLILPTS